MPETRTIQVHGHTIAYRLLRANDDEYLVEQPLKALDTPEEIELAARTRIEETEWIFHPDVRGMTLQERFCLIVAPNVFVDLYNFRTRALSKNNLEQICMALKLIYSQMADPDEWSLQTIQVIDSEPRHAQSGEWISGTERPEQRRFVLYPAALESMRDALVVQAPRSPTSITPRGETMFARMEAILPLPQMHVFRLEERRPSADSTRSSGPKPQVKRVVQLERYLQELRAS